MLEQGQRVRVHLNLHRGDFSVCDPSTGRVITNVTDITLTDVTFSVGERMRQWTIAHQRRKVMAWARGYIEAVNTDPPIEGLRQITYNPYRAGYFHTTEHGTPVKSAVRVIFKEKYAYA